MKKILVVAAHPDDEILGVGATVAKHAAQGDEVYALILGEGQTSRGEHREDISAEVVKDLHYGYKTSKTGDKRLDRSIPCEG